MAGYASQPPISDGEQAEMESTCAPEFGNKPRFCALPPHEKDANASRHRHGGFAAGFANAVSADDAATIKTLCAAPWLVSGISSGAAMARRLPPQAQPGGAAPEQATPTPSQISPALAAFLRTQSFPWYRVRIFQPDGTFTTPGGGAGRPASGQSPAMRSR